MLFDRDKLQTRFTQACTTIMNHLFVNITHDKMCKEQLHNNVMLICLPEVVSEACLLVPEIHVLSPIQ